MSDTSRTTDHQTIRQWAEERGGRPMAVRSTLEDSTEDAIIRIGFPGARQSDDSRLEEISWDEWFRLFDQNDLALLYQESADGERSNFNKLVSRDS